MECQCQDFSRKRQEWNKLTGVFYYNCNAYYGWNCQKYSFLLGARKWFPLISLGNASLHLPGTALAFFTLTICDSVELPHILHKAMEEQWKKEWGAEEALWHVGHDPCSCDKFIRPSLPLLPGTNSNLCTASLTKVQLSNSLSCPKFHSR